MGAIVSWTSWPKGKRSDLFQLILIPEKVLKEVDDL